MARPLYARLFRTVLVDAAVRTNRKIEEARGGLFALQSSEEDFMIQRFTHATLFVTDQDEAKDFYVNKLGFEVRIDNSMGQFRWLTVGPKGQPDFQIILMKLAPYGSMTAENAETMKGLIKSGLIAAGVFETADCRQTYEELSARGVEFPSPPEEKFYGIEAVFQDPFGNRFSLTQRK
jgi:catechol 2,3-dioxygenase-like lactoylglutathione lyase family enzyme